jgi:hypothetical protein
LLDEPFGIAVRLWSPRRDLDLMRPSLPVSIESIVDWVGIRLGMNCGPMLPLMPTTETLWSLFAEVVPLCFRL